MPKILYDAQAFDMQTHGGISRCFVELGKHMPPDTEVIMGLVETDNVYLSNLGLPPFNWRYSEFPFGRNNAIKKFLYKLYYNMNLGNYARWDKKPNINTAYTLELLRKGDYDIFHPTFFNPYFLPYTKGKPVVITVHDMIPELYPELFPSIYKRQIEQKQMLIPKADHIITVSEHTKRDLLKFYDIDSRKISVIHHGADTKDYVPAAAPVEGDYLLFVGGRDTYKNFVPFVKAAIPSLMKHKELSVVCTGHPFSQEETDFLKGSGVYERFIHHFVHTDQEFMDLYHNAIAFVFPSEYEGFGIPILEAYKADCPVMLNKASCFPEVAEEAAIYFSFDKRESDFSDKFEQLYTMSANEREALLQKQRRQLAKYSWTKSAQQLADVYRTLL